MAEPALLEFELPSSPDDEDDAESWADEDDVCLAEEDVPELDVDECVDPGRTRATAPAVTSPATPTVAVATRSRVRPRSRDWTAESTSALR